MTTKRRQATMIRGIPEDLWRAAKAEAALEGKTLTAWIEEALREKLDREGRKR